MADVFISYKKEDRAHAEMLDKALSAHQLTVWWDRELKSGQAYRQEILRQVEAAGAVVVVWSERSIGSDFVCDEAGAAKDARKLVPVTFDDVRPPFGFREIQAQSLAGWTGDTSDPRFLSVISQIDGARRGRMGAAVMQAGAALSEAVTRRAGDTEAARNVLNAFQFLDLFGLPLYRLTVGVLVVAALVTALWFVPAALQNAAANWPIIFVLSALCVLAARTMYQAATVVSGKYSRQFFDGGFSFWTVAAAIFGLAAIALSLPMSQISTTAILEGAPIYFNGVLLLFMTVRFVSALFGKLLQKA